MTIEHEKKPARRRRKRRAVDSDSSVIVVNARANAGETQRVLRPLTKHLGCRRRHQYLLLTGCKLCRYMPGSIRRHLRGNYTGVRYLHAHVLEQARELRDTPRYAEITLVYGTTLGQMDDLAACRSLCEQAYAIYQRLADQQGELQVLDRLGWVAREQGDTVAARTWLEQRIARARQGSNPGILIGLLTGLAEVAIVEEDADTAAALLDNVVALRKASEYQHQDGWTWNHLGHVALLHGDYGRATALHTRSLAALTAENSDTYDLAWVYQDLGQTSLAQGDLVAARHWLLDALRLCHENGDRIIQAWCLAGR